MKDKDLIRPRCNLCDGKMKGTTHNKTIIWKCQECGILQFHFNDKTSYLDLGNFLGIEERPNWFRQMFEEEIEYIASNLEYDDFKELDSIELSKIDKEKIIDYMLNECDHIWEDINNTISERILKTLENRKNKTIKNEKKEKYIWEANYEYKE